MSEELSKLEKELRNVHAEIERLNKQANKLTDKMYMQRLIDWMKANNIDTSLTEIPMNQEMHDYIVKHGFPGGYIEYELDKWSIGTPMLFRGKHDGEEGSVLAGPFHNHSGLFPPEMIKRAIAELTGTPNA